MTEELATSVHVRTLSGKVADTLFNVTENAQGWQLIKKKQGRRVGYELWAEF